MDEFVSLTNVLEAWFDKPWSELPPSLEKAWDGRPRQKAGLSFLLGLWDGLSVERRRIMAAQFDASHDPDSGDEEFDLVARQTEVELEIREWRLVATPTGRDKKEQDDALARLCLELTNIDNRLRMLAGAAPASAGEPPGAAGPDDGSQSTAAEPGAKDLSLRLASDVSVHQAIADIYKHAATNGMKPPNVREIGGYGKQLLRRRGLGAAASHIQTLAQDARYNECRGRGGVRVSGSLRAFSLEGWI